MGFCFQRDSSIFVILKLTGMKHFKNRNNYFYLGAFPFSYLNFFRMKFEVFNRNFNEFKKGKIRLRLKENVTSTQRTTLKGLWIQNF